MARRFNGTTDHISLSLGALGFSIGPGTIAAVCRVNGADKDVFSAGTGVDWALFIEGVSTKISLWVGTTGGNGTVTLTNADGWAFIAATKGAGTVTPRFYKYRYDINTWTIADGGGTLVDSPVADGSAEIGCDVGGGTFWTDDIAAVGVWNTVLTDTQLSFLPFDVSLNGWNKPAGLKGMWMLNQTAVTDQVLDLTGNGANSSAISGTTLRTDTPNMTLPNVPKPLSVVYQRKGN